MRFPRAALALALAAGTAEAEMLGAGAFATVEPSAYSAAMGGAVSALETGPSAMMSNPAGLARLDQPVSLVADGGLLNLGQTLSFVGVAGWPMPEIAVGIGALFYNAGDDIEFRMGNTADPESTADNPGGLIEASAQAYVLSVATRLLPPIDLGTSLRLLRESIGGVQGTGYSGDIAINYFPHKRVAIGAVWRDYLAPLMDWKGVPAEASANPAAAEQGIPMNLKLGCALRMDSWRAAVEGFDVTGAHKWMGWGVEWDAHPAFTLRAGMSGTLITAGFGARHAFRNGIRAGLDYAFAPGPFGEYHNRFTLTVGLGFFRLERGRMLFPAQGAP